MDPRETIPRTRMNAVVVDQRPMVMLGVVVRAHKGAGARGNQRKNERNVKGSLEAGDLKRRGWAQHRKCWYTRYAYFRLRRVYCKRGGWLYALLPGCLSGKLGLGLITTKR